MFSCNEKWEPTGTTTGLKGGFPWKSSISGWFAVVAAPHGWFVVSTPMKMADGHQLDGAAKNHHSSGFLRPRPSSGALVRFQSQHLGQLLFSLCMAQAAHVPSSFLVLPEGVRGLKAWATHRGHGFVCCEVMEKSWPICGYSNWSQQKYSVFFLKEPVNLLVGPNLEAKDL